MRLIDQEVFGNEILTSTSNVLYVVDFFAEWCGPCKMLTPVLEQLQSQYVGAIEVVKLDIDENQDLIEELDVTSVPTVMIFRGGQKVHTTVGVQPQPYWTGIIDGLLIPAANAA